jgi:hypothetical protein
MFHFFLPWNVSHLALTTEMICHVSFFLKGALLHKGSVCFFFISMRLTDTTRVYTFESMGGVVDRRLAIQLGALPAAHADVRFGGFLQYNLLVLLSSSIEIYPYLTGRIF